MIPSVKCDCPQCRYYRGEKITIVVPENPKVIYPSDEEFKAALIRLLDDPDVIKALKYLADK